MFCNKCGTIIEENSKFCGKCGTQISVSTNNTINSQLNINEKIENSNNQKSQDFYSNNTYNNYDNIINPDMKKYAIASIAVPAISIIVYWYIGLTVYIAALLAGLGFGCAKKARLYNKTLSTIGYVLNGILVAMAILAGLISILLY